MAEELEIVRRQSAISSLEHTLAQFAGRVAAPEARNLALLLIQSERLGADASTALLEFSNNQRVNLRQSAEATANRASFCRASAEMIRKSQLDLRKSNQEREGRAKDAAAPAPPAGTRTCREPPKKISFAGRNG